MTDQEIYEIVHAMRLPPGISLGGSSRIQFGQAEMRFDTRDLSHPEREDYISIPLHTFWTAYPGERYSVPKYERPSTVREVAEIVRGAIAYLSRHDADEWLSLDGTRFHNPHPEAPDSSDYHRVWNDGDEQRYAERRKPSNAESNAPSTPALVGSAAS